MDLSKVEGLTAEQVAAINAMHDESTTGLKSKVDELLDEKKTASQKAKDAEEIAEQARLAASEAEKKRLADAGKWDELNAKHEQELAAATAKAQEEAEKANNALTNYHKGNALNEALGLVHDDFKDITKPLLSSMVKIAYNDEGLATTTFEHNGEVIANNVSEFKSWASEQDAFKKILNGVDSSGAGAAQSQGSGATSGKSYSDMTLQEQIAHNSKINPQRN